MNAERLNQIEKIYHVALEVLPAEREAFFKEFCGENIELRRKIESLLSFENAFDSLIDTPPESLAAGIFFEQEKQANLTERTSGNIRAKCYALAAFIPGAAP